MSIIHPIHEHEGSGRGIPHNHSARRRKARQRYREAHTSQDVTFRLNGQIATVDSTVRLIRAQDALARRSGMGTFQRAYLHSGARADMWKHARTGADRELLNNAWEQCIADGTVPLAVDALTETELLQEGLREPPLHITDADKACIVAESLRIGQRS